MADKDLDAMAAPIAPLAEAFITVKPNNPRAMQSSELANKLKHFGVPVFDCGDVKSGVSKARDIAGKSEIICAIGSLYFSAEVRAAYESIHSKK